MENLSKTLSQKAVKNINQQYFYYKQEVNQLMVQYEIEKEKGKEIAKILRKLRDENMIDSHLSKLFMLTNSSKTFSRKADQQEDFEKVKKYFQEIQDLSIKSLKLIFDIRSFFTGQEFEIYFENGGEIFSFSMEDVEKYVHGVIPIYTDSLEKYIEKISKDSKGMGFELDKLGLSLASLGEDLQKVEGIQPYLNLIDNQIKKHKVKLSENRKLEAAIYLFERNPNIDFSSKNDKQSLYILLGQYAARGGTSDTITMYKLGDVIQKTDEGFKNIEVKMHNGTISLTMIANGIKKLYNAFNSENPQEKMEKFFTVNKKRLSNPIEKEALNKVIEQIRATFKYIE